MGRQVWTAFTNSYDAADLARNPCHDYALKLVSASDPRDRMIAGTAKPS